MTKQDFEDYAKACGYEAAYNLVLLHGPDDGFDYDEYQALLNSYEKLF